MHRGEPGHAPSRVPTVFAFLLSSDWYCFGVKTRSILLLPIAGLMLSCASSPKATPVPDRPAIQSEVSAQTPSLRERLDQSSAWNEDPRGEFLALLGEFLGQDYKVTLDEFRWEPGSAQGRGLHITASAPGPVLRAMHFEDFSIGETDFGFEFSGKLLDGSLHVELTEDGSANQISVAISAEDLLAPKSIDLSLGKYGLEGDVSVDLELVLSSSQENSHRWQWGDAEFTMITSKSGLSIVQPEPGSGITLGRPALIASWDSVKRRLQVGGGFRGDGHMTALTAVAATYDTATDSFRLEGKVDTVKPLGSYELSGSILDPVLTPDSPAP